MKVLEQSETSETTTSVVQVPRHSPTTYLLDQNRVFEEILRKQPTTAFRWV